jgi:hypothetical protein
LADSGGQLRQDGLSMSSARCGVACPLKPSVPVAGLLESLEEMLEMAWG